MIGIIYYKYNKVLLTTMLGAGVAGPGEAEADLIDLSDAELEGGLLRKCRGNDGSVTAGVARTPRHA